MSELKKAMARRKAQMAIKEKKKELKRDELYLKYGFKTNQMIKDELQEQYDRDFKSFPIEKRQRFLDLFLSGFGNVKACYEEVGISQECAFEVMKRAIGSAPTWKTKVEE